jgi:heme/copper-type cytochrome/quinol oxidase subunit 1
VWNLLQISGRESVASISPAWLQAHGHAQVFGWVGSFILGIGFYSIPKMRGGAKSSFTTAWVCWAMWTTGATMRWAANVYL